MALQVGMFVGFVVFVCVLTFLLIKYILDNSEEGAEMGGSLKDALFKSSEVYE